MASQRAVTHDEQTAAVPGSRISVRRLDPRNLAGVYAAVGGRLSSQSWGRRARSIAMAIPCALGGVAGASASSFYDEPAGLRLLLTLDRQSNYAATLGRQASVAFLGGGSVNPAANGWTRRPGQSPSVLATYVDAPSAGGRSVVAVPVTAQWSLPEGGSMFAAYAYTDTPDQAGDNGLRYLLRSNEWTLGYGAFTGPELRTGATFRFVDGKFASESYSPALFGQIVGADTRLHGPDVAIGLAGRLHSTMTFGISGTIGWISTTTSVTLPHEIALPATGAAAMVLPAGTLLDSFSDPIRSLALRGGVGFQPDPSVGLYGDVTFNAIDSQRSGSLQVGRFLAGVECLPQEDWMLRAGASIDTEREVDLSAGLGLRLGRDAEVQLAFQNNAAPELNPEFGRTRLFSASIAVRW